jgi:serralysin
VVGTAGANAINGNTGNDTITGGLGIDLLNGGLGTDTLEESSAAANMFFNMTTGAIIANPIFPILVDTALNFENVNSGSGNDGITGSIVANIINTNFGNDTVNAGIGNDTVNGGSDNDTLNGEAGNDSMDGGFGNDTLDGGIDADSLFGNFGNDSLVAGFGNDTLNGGFVIASVGTDVVNGGTDFLLLDNDFYDSSAIGGNYDINMQTGVTVGLAGTTITAFETVRTGAGVNTVTARVNGSSMALGGGADFGFGAAGADRINGDAGGDDLRGGDGIDVINGGSEADIIRGQGGSDNLTGGTGADSFRFDTVVALAGTDTITDYNVVDDSILIEDLFFGAVGPSLSANEFVLGAAALDADDRIIYNAATGNIVYDTNGNGIGGATTFARVTAGTALTLADFIVT